MALGRWEGLGVGVSRLPCLILGRSKFLWLHSFFAFLYFITNLLFMMHHCLGFVPRKSYAVSEKNYQDHAPSPRAPLAPHQPDHPTPGLQKHPSLSWSAHPWGAVRPSREASSAYPWELSPATSVWAMKPLRPFQTSW